MFFSVWDADEGVLIVGRADRNVAMTALLALGMKAAPAKLLLDDVAADPEGMAIERAGITVLASTEG